MEINDGTYRGRALTWGLSETRNGHPQVVVTFQFLDEGFEEVKRDWYGHFTDKSLQITIKALRACGWEGQDLDRLDGLDLNEVELVVANETYEGKTRTKIQFVNAPGSGPVAAPMPVDKVKALSARIKGQIVAFDKAQGHKPAPKPKPTPEEDVPFS